MFILRRHPAFARLWTANLVSSLAGWSFGIALAAHAYLVTGSATVSAGLVVAATAPSAILGSVGGVVADRVDRAALLRATAWVRVLLVAVLLPWGDQPWVWYAVVLLQAGAQQLFTPAEQALVTDLVDHDHLASATGANSVATNATRLVGPALGGVLLGLTGFGGTVLVVLVLLATSALLLTTPIGSPSTTSPVVRGRPWADWRSGLRVVRRQPEVRAVTVLQALDGLKEGAFTALLPVLVLGVIGADPAFLGTASSMFAVSAVAAGPVVALIVRRYGYRGPIAVGASASGVLLMVLGLAPQRGTTLVTFLLSGFPFTVSWVAAGTLLLLRSPASHRGRVVGTTGSLYAATTLISAAVAGGLAALVGPAMLLMIAAALQIAAGPVFMIMTRARESPPAAADQALT